MFNIETESGCCSAKSALLSAAKWNAKSNFFVFNLAILEFLVISRFISALVIFFVYLFNFFIISVPIDPDEPVTKILLL